ncbi:MAG: KH domain-containing protein [Christensenellaceae bacterium]|jgi:spoIIIJ-associated protein|nr:KH domain-containing protein [Christensenellaceae bacterium]
MEKQGVETQGKTIDDAITEALVKLNASYDEVDVEILSEGGFLKKARVLVTLKSKEKDIDGAKNLEIFPKVNTTRGMFERETPRDEVKKAEEAKEEIKEVKPRQNKNEKKTFEKKEFDIEYSAADAPVSKPKKEIVPTEFNPDAPKFVKTLEFTEKLFNMLTENVRVSSSATDREFIINVKGDDIGRLIGKNGLTMQAIQTLVSQIAINNANGEGRRVVLDIDGYKEQRDERAIAKAKSKAEYVRDSGRTYKFEPMNPRERAIIHTALQDEKGVKTYSVGKEPNRCLVIAPAD